MTSYSIVLYHIALIDIQKQILLFDKVLTIYALIPII